MPFSNLVLKSLNPWWSIAQMFRVVARQDFGPDRLKAVKMVQGCCIC